MINGWEWVIILVVVLLVFGVGRISKLGSEMGKGIRAFKEGLEEEKENETEPSNSETKTA